MDRKEVGLSTPLRKTRTRDSDETKKETMVFPSNQKRPRGTRTMPKRYPDSGEALSQNVTFSSKELFLEINRKLDSLGLQLNTKGDKADFDRLESVVMDLQRKGGDAAQQALRLSEEAVSKVQKLEKDASDLVSKLQKETSDRVGKLEKEAASNSAVRDNTEQIEKEHTNSRWQWAAIIVTALLGLAQLFVTIAKAH